MSGDAPGAPRATGASLAAIILVAVGMAGVIVLHLLRTDLDPVREVMSGYANGSHGILMTIAFYSLGAAALAMATRLPRATPRSVVARTIVGLLAAAGIALILAGVFEVERPFIPDTIEEVIHSDAAIGAFVLIIVAMLLFTVICRNDPRWRGFFTVAVVLAASATVAAAFSPLADKTPWTGIAQRTLALVVFTWMLLVAVRIRFHRSHRPPSPIAAGPV